MKRRLCISILLVVSSVAVYASGDAVEQDLKRLDAALALSGDYDSYHDLRVKTLTDLLGSQTSSPEQRYALYGQLFAENYAHQFNAALSNLEHQDSAAVLLGRSRQIDVAIKKALLLTTSGLFLESREVIEQLDTTKFTPSQRLEYCKYMQRFCFDYREFNENTGAETAPLVGKTRYYRGEVIAHTADTDPIHLELRIRNLIDEHRFEEANLVSQRMIGFLSPDCHDYAIATYWQGVISEALGDEDGTIHWYVESAIADIKNAVKDNASLCSVALRLLNRGDVVRAFRYIQFAQSDALFYNSKLRPWQISQSMPAIEQAYNNAQQQHAKSLRIWIIATALLALALLSILIVVLNIFRKERRSHKRIAEMNEQIREYSDSLTEANEKLTAAIGDLSEANRAKEEYLGLFLSMCSSYIGKLKKFMTREQIDEELENFYKTFDNAFLELYPNFVEEFNSLLKPEERIELKKDELLNTELRIFALIKLGITSSSHIASLLRYSVNTIYNYRAQIKNAALEDREDFEEKVRSIGNPRS